MRWRRRRRRLALERMRPKGYFRSIRREDWSLKRNQEVRTRRRVEEEKRAIVEDETAVEGEEVEV